MLDCHRMAQQRRRYDATYRSQRGQCIENQLTRKLPQSTDTAYVTVFSDAASQMVISVLPARRAVTVKVVGVLGTMLTMVGSATSKRLCVSLVETVAELPASR